MGLSLLTQVLIVRTLSKDDFGSFAYALALAALIQSFLALGLDRSDTYFLTKFDEAGDAGRLLGLLVVELMLVAISGAVVLVTLGGLTSVVNSDVSRPVLLALVATAPLMAVDALVLNAFAVFAAPRVIFLRRYVLDPILRLTVVVVLMITGMALISLATGYLLAAIVGTGIYLVLLIRLVRRVLVRHGARTSLAWPGRQVFRYAMPLLLGAVMYAATLSLPILVLKSVGSTADVAEVRAVQPVAALILVVPTVFATLFLPRAARLAARKENEALRRHYWATAIWVAVLAFPAVVLFVAFAPSVTTALFGDRYADAARPLAIMALAFFANAALGLNGSFLQVTGQLRHLTFANLAGLITAVVTSAALIPAFGADGAACAVAAALLVPQALKQLGLRGTPVRSIHASGVRLWLFASLLLAVAFAVSMAWPSDLIIALLTTIICSAVLVAVMRRELMESNIFPVGRMRWSRQPAAPGNSDLEGRAKPGDVEADLPGSWQCLDWRFLDPDPSLGTVLPLGVRRDIPRALKALGESVVDAPATRMASPPVAVNTVIASGAGCELQTLGSVRSMLDPSGRLVIEVSSPPPSIHRRVRWRRWTAWRDHLGRAGFIVNDIYIALPNLNRTSAMVRLDERGALVAALRRQPVQPLKRLAALGAVAAIRVGLAEAVCRHGVIIARIIDNRPSETHQ
jgi:O-antigen/teichoic acid export membrane protein